jgi:hypothetical protein
LSSLEVSVSEEARNTSNNIRQTPKSFLGIKAAKRKIPLKMLSLADARLRARYGARFALIRPDQHVAWCGDDLPADCRSLIARVTGSVRKAAPESLTPLHQEVL